MTFRQPTVSLALTGLAVLLAACEPEVRPTDRCWRVEIQTLGRVDLADGCDVLAVELAPSRYGQDPQDRTFEPVAWVPEIVLRPNAAQRIRERLASGEESAHTIRVRIGGYRAHGPVMPHPPFPDPAIQGFLYTRDGRDRLQIGGVSRARAARAVAAADTARAL